MWGVVLLVGTTAHGERHRRLRGHHGHLRPAALDAVSHPGLDEDQCPYEDQEKCHNYGQADLEIKTLNRPISSEGNLHPCPAVPRDTPLAALIPDDPRSPWTRPLRPVLVQIGGQLQPPSAADTRRVAPVTVGLVTEAFSALSKLSNALAESLSDQARA